MVLISRLFFLLMLLMPSLAHGRTVQDAGVSAHAVDLASISEVMQLHPQLSILEDPTARLDIDSALASPDWQPAATASLNRGYTKSAFWLRGSLYNSGASPVTRWLAVGSARLEHVNYFSVSAVRGDIEQTVFSGSSQPLDTRPVASRIPVFPVTLAAGEQMEFVLQIRSRSSVDIHVALWEPGVFRQKEGLELAAQSVLIGLPVVLALYALIQGIVWRDKGFLLLTLWIILALAYICSFQGYLYRYLLTGGGDLVLRAPSTIAGATNIVYAMVTLVFVGVHRLTVWKWMYRLMTTLLLVATLWTAFGDYRSGAEFSNMVIGGFFLMWILSMLHAWRHKLNNARLFILSFVVVWLGMLGKLLEINGILQQRWLADWQLSWLFQLCIWPMMSLIVIGRSLEMYRKHRQMQQTLLQTQALEQIRLEQAVAERTQALREALIAADEANHAKTDFLARISHDLRTPLTSILGFADMVQAGNGENAGRGRIISRSAKHMLAMVNDLIDYARGDNADTLQIAPVYVHALINTMAQEGEELARRQQNRFVFKIIGALPPVLQLDAKRLHRMLANLLDNAAKYTRDGNIVLEVQCHTATAGRLMLEFRVADTGCGIAPEHQSLIFEPFERADAARSLPGIGLGLAIVRQWITRMQGTIAVDSTPGCGTVVTLRLPTEIAAEENIARHHVQEMAEAQPLIDGNGLLIQVVEDSPDIRQLLMDQLSGLGFAVEVSVDGSSAIERMSHAGGARPDLLMTDYLMSGADGGAVLQAARRYWPGVPVVLLSATPQANADDEENSLHAFDASLLKPVNFIELQATLANLLQLDSIAFPEQASEEMPLTLPPEKVLKTAHHLIDLGAISDLIDWADMLMAEYPQCELFVVRARQLIAQGNLAGLGKLCRA